MKYRFYLLLFTCFFILSFKTSLLCTNKHFEVLNAFSSSWSAGTLQGGSGTEFYFDIIIKSKQKIIFDSIWINNCSSKIFISKKQKSISSAPIEFKKGDTITLRTSMSNNNVKQVKSPKQTSDGALLSYRINDKLKYFKINKIESQKPIYYQ
jgi:hypothetical protein